MLIPPPLPRRLYSGVHRFWLTFGMLVCLVALAIALFYVKEDWRCGRLWASTQADLRAKGEILDWHHFVAPPVPDDRNLAMTPLFVRALAYQSDPKTHTYTFGPRNQRPNDLADMPFGNDKHAAIKTAAYDLARHPDLAGYQLFYRQKAGFPQPAQPGLPAADVLLALTRYGPALDELAWAASERPSTRFPLDWQREEFWGLYLPHYTLVQNLVRTLCLRASAELELGDHAAATRDLGLSLRLCRDVGAEHILIGALTEIVCLGNVLNDVWLGLADRRWSAEELTWMQSELQAVDMLAVFADAMRFERATTIYNLDFIKRSHDAMIFTLDDSRPHDANARRANKVLGWLIPGGWFDENKAIISRYEQAYDVETVDARAHRAFPARAAEGWLALAETRLSLRLIPARIMLPVFASITTRFARMQTALDQAVIACAMERYFLEHQNYPARLDDLVPGYLAHVPIDLVDGTPMRYHPTADGRFRLHAVGWDGHDDGGQVVWDGRDHLNRDKGDWVWQYVELKNPAPGR